MKNNFEFKLPDFPNDTFLFENNVFSGKGTLKQNGNLVEQSKEKGKPYLIKRTNNEIIKAFPKMNYPDLSAMCLHIEGKKYKLATTLKWYEYLIGGIPFILCLSGGAIGGLIGGLATFSNYAFFRGSESTANKYMKVIGVNILCLLFYFFVAKFVHNLVH